MSVESCTAFLHATRTSPTLGRQLKAMTAVPELVRLGRRHGYVFDAHDLAVASSAMKSPEGGPPAGRADRAAPADRADRPGRPPEMSAYHYEYRLAEVPGLDVIGAELPRLKVSPPSVDLDQFDRAYREDDLRSTSMSPADPEFRAWYAEMRAAERQGPRGDGGPRRDFHLVNLDEHTDHEGYEGYLAAKTRTISALEAFFGAEIRCSGSMWYPPGGYRLWHTNQNQPGWRMYVIDFDGAFDDPAETSFFRYLNPRTRAIVTLPERPRMVRFFRAEQEPSRLFWHCIVNPTARHRWSFGYVVPDDWHDALAQAVPDLRTAAR